MTGFSSIVSKHKVIIFNWTISLAFQLFLKLSSHVCLLSNTMLHYVTSIFNKKIWPLLLILWEVREEEYVRSQLWLPLAIWGQKLNHMVKGEVRLVLWHQVNWPTPGSCPETGVGTGGSQFVLQQAPGCASLGIIWVNPIRTLSSSVGRLFVIIRDLGEGGMHICLILWLLSWKNVGKNVPALQATSFPLPCGPQHSQTHTTALKHLHETWFPGSQTMLMPPSLQNALASLPSKIQMCLERKTPLQLIISVAKSME